MGGVSLEPSLTAPADIYFPAGAHQSNPNAPIHWDSSDNKTDSAGAPQKRTRLPREDGTDIGISSPVPLSDEAVSIITKLREMKDKDEDYSRWRDVVFRAKNAEKLSVGKHAMASRSDDLDGRASKRAREVEEREKAKEDKLASSLEDSSEPPSAIGASPDLGRSAPSYAASSFRYPQTRPFAAGCRCRSVLSRVLLTAPSRPQARKTLHIPPRPAIHDPAVVFRN